MRLVWPALDFLSSHAAALERGWLPDSVEGAGDRARAALERIERDPIGYVASLVDREATGTPLTLPDGAQVARLPGYRKWMWDGEFCGSIGFRWQPGTAALPPYCLGHIGYTVVPWKRRLGYATQALGHILEDARQEGLPYVEVTTDPDNIPSQRVIEANGGLLLERFVKPPEYGNAPGLRYRIPLT